MKEVTFVPSECPDCGETTSPVKLGEEPPRVVCGRAGCDWDGANL